MLWLANIIDSTRKQLFSWAHIRQPEAMFASPPLDMCKPLQLGCHQTFPSGVFQLREIHAVVKGRLIGRDARLVEGALGLLQFQ
jgi:hypothetical protein